MEKMDVFLDSGAFSAWNCNSEVNLDDYIAFALRHLDHLEVIANLDVIPGKPFQKLTQADIDHSSRQGWDNYQKMLAAGIPKEKLIHVFHQGEDFKWLKRIAASMPYIGLSPANDKTTEQKMAWLDRCMPYVTDENGMPTVKYHGFAVTSFRLMIRFPWYSVDSTSWNYHGRVGGVYVPRYRQGKWIYNEQPWILKLSTRSPAKKEAGQHFDNFSPAIQKIFLRFFEEKGQCLGSSELRTEDADYQLEEDEKWAGKAADGKRGVEKIIVDGLSNNHWKRDELNIQYFADLERELPAYPTPYLGKLRGGLGL